ncbi:hypothetical protein P5V47_03445 [Mycobacteroides abscessus subsp. massiliense]|uniref:Rv0361 family membrane protein n=1 Tax=Mycobacteroides abscessus TaxID=36809 RepID=UPI00266BD9A9|nr:hypothetical protein [Mycobacteroides abscessus]MDO3297745.1 hypothetical protein [Mycobacteroides abscessus subsp. massiliense]
MEDCSSAARSVANGGLGNNALAGGRNYWRVAAIALLAAVLGLSAVLLWLGKPEQPQIQAGGDSDKIKQVVAEAIQVRNGDDRAGFVKLLCAADRANFGAGAISTYLGIGDSSKETVFGKVNATDVNEMYLRYDEANAILTVWYGTDIDHASDVAFRLKQENGKWLICNSSIQKIGPK